MIVKNIKIIVLVLNCIIVPFILSKNCFSLTITQSFSPKLSDSCDKISSYIQEYCNKITKHSKEDPDSCIKKGLNQLGCTNMKNEDSNSPTVTISSTQSKENNDTLPAK